MTHTMTNNEVFGPILVTDKMNGTRIQVCVSCAHIGIKVNRIFMAEHGLMVCDKCAYYIESRILYIQRHLVGQR